MCTYVPKWKHVSFKSVYRAIIWLDIVLYIYSISADTRHFGTYLYRTTCFATNSGTTEKSRYLIDNVLKMGICQQSLDDVNAGTSHIYSCEYSGTDILLTSKLYTRADCAVSHESDADGVIPEPWSDHMLSSECEGATGQQSLWRCERPSLHIIERLARRGPLSKHDDSGTRRMFSNIYTHCLRLFGRMSP